MTVYIIETTNEHMRHRRLEVPDGARLTFGPAVPFTPKGRFAGGGPTPNGYCLRVYDEKKIMAAFDGVISFRREDIQLTSYTAENAQEALQ